MNETLDTPRPSTETTARRGVQPAPGRATPRPDLVGGQARLDGSAAELTWQPLPAAHAYHVQVAASPRFDELLFDDEVGDATAVTLYELLPTDGRRFHWRVRARTDEGWTPFSRSAALLAVSDEEAEAWREERNRRREERTQAQTIDGAAPSDDAPPYRAEVTSPMQAALFLALILAMIVGLLLLNFVV